MIKISRENEKENDKDFKGNGYRFQRKYDKDFNVLRFQGKCIKISRKMDTDFKGNE
jgi:hypothetical protein